MLYILSAISIVGFLMARCEVDVPMIPLMIETAVLCSCMVLIARFKELSYEEIKYGYTTGNMGRHSFDYKSLVHLEGNKAYFIKKDAVIITENKVPEKYVGPINIQVEIRQDCGAYAIFHKILTFRQSSDTVKLILTK